MFKKIKEGFTGFLISKAMKSKWLWRIAFNKGAKRAVQFLASVAVAFLTTKFASEGVNAKLAEVGFTFIFDPDMTMIWLTGLLNSGFEVFRNWLKHRVPELKEAL